MGLIFTESFDGASVAAATGKWTGGSGLLLVTSTTPSLHGHAYISTTGGPFELFNTFKGDNAGDAHATFTVGWRGNPSYSSSEEDLATLSSDNHTTRHLTMTISSGKVIKVYRGTSAGTLLGSSAPLTAPAYLEWTATLGASGYVEVRVDGVTVISFSGNTKNGGTMTVFDSFGIDVSSLSDSNTSIDDVYVTNGAGSTNTSFLGDVTILVSKPNANGDLSMCVNDSGNSTNNYSHTALSGGGYADGVNTNDEDLYNMGDISGYAAPFVLAGVVVYAAAGKTDSGARSWALHGKTGGTETAGPTIALPIDTAPSTYHKWALDLEPSGGAWSFSDFNSTQFGMEAL